jgi:leader peptidase (prepilin peptidase)/N-methyltransferase
VTGPTPASSDPTSASSDPAPASSDQTPASDQVQSADPWFEPVSRRPVPVVVVAVVVVAVIAVRLGWRADLPAFLFLGVIGTMLSFIDVALKRLPDPLTLPGAAGVAVLLALACLDVGFGHFLGALYGMGALFVFYAVQWFVAPSQIGLGDVKLALSLGLVLGWLGLQAFILGVFAIQVLGGVWAIGLIIVRRGGLKSSFPFGPFMLAGTLVALLVHA